VLSILVRRARALCDHESLHDELEFLGDTQVEWLRWPADPTLSQSTEGSRYHPGEAHFCRPSSLCQLDFPSHQPYAVQAQHKVCGLPIEENC
jgi:hypothetical protein